MILASYDLYNDTGLATGTDGTNLGLDRRQI